MAKISAKKSDLKTIANRIIVSPSTDAVADLKFKRRKDFSTFIKWIDSSNKALDRIKLPSKKEVEKLGKGTGGSNWLPALLALLGLGAFAALNKDKDKGGDSDTGSGVTTEDPNTGVKVPQGSSITSMLDITRQLNDKNIRRNNQINRNNKKIDLKNKNTLKTNLKNAKTKSNWIKNLKSNTLRNKFWTKGGTKPEVTNLGKRIKSVQLKHGSKTMKVGSGTFSATKAQAPLIPDPLNKNIIKKQPLSKTSFKTNVKNLFKPSGLKNLGKGFVVGWAADEFIEKPLLNQIDKAGFHFAKRQIDGLIKEHGVAKVYRRQKELHTKFVNKKEVKGLDIFGDNKRNQKMADMFSENINYIKINYRTQLEEAGIEVGPVYRTKGVDYSSNTLQSKKEVATIPFPIITTDMSEKFDLPTLNTDVFAKSFSSESSIPFGLNSDDNPFSDLLLNSLK